MSVEVRVPTLGESVTEATVATWFKKPGDTVAVDEMLCELETDKVTVEVPSPAAGTLAEIVAAEGSTVGVDALLASIGEGSGAAAAEAAPAAPKAAPAESGGESVDVMVPTLGESVTEATVSTWFKKVGDTVVQDEMLCELETDKVSVEVPAPAAGVLTEILAPEGATVEASAKLAVLGGAGAVAAPSEPAPAPAAPTAQGKDVEDAPSAKKLMAENNLASGDVQGTGRDGRVMKGDVLAALAAPKAAAPAPSAAPRAPVAAEDAAREERVKMTKLRQTIAKRLKDSQNTAAMLTTYNEVDMTETMALRKEYKDLFEKKHGVRLGFMSFFTKACCHALKEVPEVNAEIDGTDIVYKNFVHMGIAAGTPQGLVVPVIRDADRMSFAEIEAAIAEKGRRARDGKLSMAEMQGGTFTISNGGVYGSLMSSPILNPPQSGILGMHKIQDRPMVINGEIKIRPMMYLALSYDHRIVDGKGAVTFLVRVKEALEDPRRLLMDL
ncbi:dihydrolipoyllysine-residue succinyltransferase component of 2-oxoglutarate dehydrogenase complex [Dinoroseobacter shibae DFL 12 = DSM 16493]|jgi:2-oxoglutarate dehydrogenase E2 component (dihydrolipoamide succinyltransferase)|uniref:Dihydrolipoyllysine-residue succinyltransferase component of 2-oxoglutarate dehydrogenase complex n=1 Tax=Dinoroseobacter shibae (strain DSM 16493 / NCIMB 14021 / DFL 12) TaxID=398580 RepID=A8LJL4_DINSH|nr:2-oxoglutarate dehydrogenase complex dihydrolipoyllysine-residue succinyltransferase [Dinoroseobacter shibae]ABV94617.1 dihydrolipoyllysine-residue succinyltransferase component of 2-oxoglutarate dehydrogenase complex [Dinoroseobacter shibae DFL 12 = DSM 16493]URF46044.1 2-oxoglutarate dehydrogenase complex dihydrolipoyllysine-residue succinyltransferase [Dinoroseobacter shibae]URF50350.1 2-oxoglutarate dehydrogenase complex dihydrolipoyllysine-residue succinyltransferase [Dinoroseobacter shi